MGKDTPFMLDGSFYQKKTHEGFITSELTLFKVSKETLEQILRSRNTMLKLKLFIKTDLKLWRPNMKDSLKNHWSKFSKKIWLQVCNDILAYCNTHNSMSKGHKIFKLNNQLNSWHCYINYGTKAFHLVWQK